MSLKKSKTALLDLLRLDSNKVVALTGKWGTGKTFLWEEVRSDATDTSVQGALYASLFSVESIPDLKVKLARSKLGKDPDSTWKAGQKVMGRLRDVLREALPDYSPVLSAIDTIALVAVPTMLRNQLLVLDDLERKPSSVSTDALLGFINEFVEHFGCRVVLILNDEQWKSAEDASTWRTLREKVIDAEVRLLTTPAEAIDIACLGAPTEHAGLLRNPVEICGITNIRVLRKIARVLNMVLEGHEQVAPEIAGRIVPSTVLLTAIHFGALPGGPSIDYVLRFNEVVATANRREDRGGEDADRAEQQWADLLSKLGIHSTDRYERELVRFLELGVVDSDAVLTQIRTYVADAERHKAHLAADAIHDMIHFRPDVSSAEILEAGRGLVPISGMVSPRQLSSVCRLLREIDSGGEAVATQLVNGWVRHFQENPPADDIELSDWNPFGDAVEPEIEQAIADLHTARMAPVSLFQAAEAVAGGVEGARERAAFGAASPELYEAILRQLTGEDLKMFMRQHFHMVRRPGQDEYGHAAEAFLEACRRIVVSPETPRLAWIVRRLCETQRPPINLHNADGDQGHTGPAGNVAAG